MTNKLTDEQIKAAELKKAEKNTKIKERLLGYKMRELQADDIFKIIEIVNILNVADLVTEFLKQQDAAKIKSQKMQGLSVIASQSDDNKKESLTDQIKTIQQDISSQSFEYVSKAAKFVLVHSSEIKTELNGLLADLTGKTTEEFFTCKGFFRQAGITRSVRVALLIQNHGGMHKLRDTLFKRYSDVSFLLSTIKWRDVPDFLITMFEEQSNDELWRIYLSNPLREDTFNDFKQKILESNRPKEQVEQEAQTAARHALDMLDSVGGDSFGI